MRELGEGDTGERRGKVNEERESKKVEREREREGGTEITRSIALS